MTNNELDTLMAVEVMGYKLDHENMWLDKDKEYTYSYCSSWEKKQQLNCISSFTPTTDMNQAMECVDAAGIEIVITRFKKKGNYQVGFGTGYRFGAENCKELPLAICRTIEKAIK